AKKAGTATITAKTANGKKATCKVTVKAPSAKKITLETSSLTLYKGEKQTLSYTLSPANAVGEVTFKSSKTSVITVSAKGVVKAKKAGTATVTAALANGKKATCKVTVYTEPSSISLSKTALLLATGDTSDMSYELSSTTDYTTVTWKSSDTSVAAVDSDGKITAKENGTATVTATTANGKSASCAVTVDGPHITALSVKEDRQYLQKGGTCQLQYEVSPSVFVDTLSWSSSNPSVAAVDSSGKITGVQAGTATITVSASFSEAQISGNTITTTARSFSDSCEVTVTEGLYIDISNGSVTITADTVTQNGAVYEYDDTYGVTLVQSGSQSENIIKVQSYTKPVHVILAGVNLKSDSIALDVGAYYYNVTVELKTGTENYLESYGSSTIASPMRCVGGNAILTGGGKLTLVSHSAPALLVATGLNISGGTITAVTYDSEAGVIGTKNGRCSDITISGSAKVYAYGGYEAVGAGKSGTNESDTISVATGTVTYSSTVPSSF
ncbi:MAG: Ig-like domain-containing protein, partial [Lachnospiraceae bacterium]|nr:Ig-like domain-containing protein [Lachnospiraceae bacterium]